MKTASRHTSFNLTLKYYISFCLYLFILAIMQQSYDIVRKRMFWSVMSFQIELVMVPDGFSS